MPTQQRKAKPTLGNLNRLLDYSKYLYEQENQRNEKLTSVTNIYLVVITFAFSFMSGLLSLISPSSETALFNLNISKNPVLYIGLGVAVVLILLSLIFTLLVVKVRSFERLCNPKDYVTEAEHFKTEQELVGSMIAHYVVATERNFLVNNKKAAHLANALQSYVFGFVILLLAIVGFFVFGR